MLYTILLLFLVLLVGILGILGTRKVILDKMKAEIASTINGINKVYLQLEYEKPLIANTSMVDGFTFDPLDIVSIVDQEGNTLEGNIRYDSNPSFDSTKNGKYTVIYTGSYHGKEVTKTTTIEVVTPIAYDYGATKVEETFTTITNGLYQIRLWGASGGYGLHHGQKTYAPGKGAYTSGNIYLTTQDILYINVGTKGEDATGCTSNGTSLGGRGGYNGGGNGGDDNNPEPNAITCANEPGGGGGGATDIRINPSKTFPMTQANTVKDCENSGEKICRGGTTTPLEIITLNQNEQSYGPYKSYPAGVYLITYEGTNLTQGSYKSYVAAGHMPDGIRHTFTITPVTQTNTKYQYLLYLEKDYDNVEFFIQNTGTSPLTITSVKAESVSSRIMVASGGGGSNFSGAGGNAGSLTSEATATAMGSTQTSGYRFAVGMIGQISSDGDGGGGGGYYGGSSVTTGTRSGATGGSSFISGYLGCNAISNLPSSSAITHTGNPNHYSGYRFSNAVMKSGSENMPTFDLSNTMTGNSDDGHAKIIPLIMENAIQATNLVNNSGFESDLTGWNKTNTAVIDVIYNGWNSGKSVKMETTDASGTYQRMDQIFIIGSAIISGHKYYASEWYKINQEDTSGIKVYSEIVYQNSSNTYKGTLGNFFTLNTSRTGDWQFGSFTFTPQSGEEYHHLALRPLITNNTKGVSSSQADSVLLIDLTETYGSGNEPSKEWCDQNIKYFDGTSYVPIYKKDK